MRTVQIVPLSTFFFFGWTIYLKAGPEERCNALTLKKKKIPQLNMW